MSANEQFEFVASAFYADTGMLRPGKSQSDALNGTPSDDERRACWEEWSKRNSTIIKCFIRSFDENFGSEP